MLRFLGLLTSGILVMSSCSEKKDVTVVTEKPTEKSIIGAYRALVSALGDGTLSQEERDIAQRMLLKANEDAIPVLIGSLKDDRVYNPRWLPANVASGDIRKLTVGEAADMTLNALVFPNAPRGFHIPDWSQFWDEHKGMKLSEIQNEVRSKFGDGTQR